MTVWLPFAWLSAPQVSLSAVVLPERVDDHKSTTQAMACHRLTSSFPCLFCCRTELCARWRLPIWGSWCA